MTEIEAKKEAFHFVMALGYVCLLVGVWAFFYGARHKR